MTTGTVWLGVGLLGQGMFFSRFLVQWLASEKAGRSVFPMAFWYLSLSGGALLLNTAAGLQTINGGEVFPSLRPVADSTLPA